MKTTERVKLRVPLRRGLIGPLTEKNKIGKGKKNALLFPIFNLPKLLVCHVTLLEEFRLQIKAFI